MNFIECTTQAEVDAVKPGDVAVVRKGYFAASGSATVRAYGSATVHASGSATVHAYGSATVHASGSATVYASNSVAVTAYGTSTVTAYGSVTVHASGSATVHAYGTSTVTAYDSVAVHAYGTSMVYASGTSMVHASKLVPVHKVGDGPKISGGVILNVPDLETCDAQTWLDYYGVSVTKAGYAVLFKAVYGDYQTDRGERWTYTPGAKLTPERWDAGRHCGDGLHLCARPFLSQRYLIGATKYVAVKVKAADLVPLGDKVKVPALTVLHEVDIDGNKVVSA